MVLIFASLFLAFPVSDTLYSIEEIAAICCHLVLFFNNVNFPRMLHRFNKSARLNTREYKEYIYHDTLLEIIY